MTRLLLNEHTDLQYIFINENTNTLHVMVPLSSPDGSYIRGLQSRWAFSPMQVCFGKSHDSAAKNDSALNELRRFIKTLEDDMRILSSLELFDKKKDLLKQAKDYVTVLEIMASNASLAHLSNYPVPCPDPIKEIINKPSSFAVRQFRQKEYCAKPSNIAPPFFTINRERYSNTLYHALDEHLRNTQYPKKIKTPDSNDASIASPASQSRFYFIHPYADPNIVDRRRLNFMTQFLLSEIQLYARVANLSNADFGRVLDDNTHLAKQLAITVKTAFESGNDIEQAVCQFINDNTVHFNLNRKLNPVEINHASIMFNKYFTDMRHCDQLVDEFMTLEPEPVLRAPSKRIGHRYQGALVFDLSELMNTTLAPNFPHRTSGTLNRALSETNLPIDLPARNPATIGTIDVDEKQFKRGIFNAINSLNEKNQVETREYLQSRLMTTLEDSGQKVFQWCGVEFFKLFDANQLAQDIFTSIRADITDATLSHAFYKTVQGKDRDAQLILTPDMCRNLYNEVVATTNNTATPATSALASRYDTEDALKKILSACSCFPLAMITVTAGSQGTFTVDAPSSLISKLPALINNGSKKLHLTQAMEKSIYKEIEYTCGDESTVYKQMNTFNNDRTPEQLAYALEQLNIVCQIGYPANRGNGYVLHNLTEESANIINSIHAHRGLRYRVTPAMARRIYQLVDENNATLLKDLNNQERPDKFKTALIHLGILYDRVEFHDEPGTADKPAIRGYDIFLPLHEQAKLNIIAREAGISPPTAPKQTDEEIALLASGYTPGKIEITGSRRLQLDAIRASAAASAENPDKGALNQDAPAPFCFEGNKITSVRKPIKGPMGDMYTAEGVRLDGIIEIIEPVFFLITPEGVFKVVRPTTTGLLAQNFAVAMDSAVTKERFYKHFNLDFKPESPEPMLPADDTSPAEVITLLAPFKFGENNNNTITCVSERTYKRPGIFEHTAYGTDSAGDPFKLNFSYNFTGNFQVTPANRTEQQFANAMNVETLKRQFLKAANIHLSGDPAKPTTQPEELKLQTPVQPSTAPELIKYGSNKFYLTQSMAKSVYKELKDTCGDESSVYKKINKLAGCEKILMALNELKITCNHDVKVDDLLTDLRPEIGFVLTGLKPEMVNKINNIHERQGLRYRVTPTMAACIYKLVDEDNADLLKDLNNTNGWPDKLETALIHLGILYDRVEFHDEPGTADKPAIRGYDIFLPLHEQAKLNIIAREAGISPPTAPKQTVEEMSLLASEYRPSKMEITGSRRLQLDAIRARAAASAENANTGALNQNAPAPFCFGGYKITSIKKSLKGPMGDMYTAEGIRPGNIIDRVIFRISPEGELTVIQATATGLLAQNFETAMNEDPDTKERFYKHLNLLFKAPDATITQPKYPEQPANNTSPAASDKVVNNNCQYTALSAPFIFGKNKNYTIKSISVRQKAPPGFTEAHEAFGTDEAGKPFKIYFYYSGNNFQVPNAASRGSITKEFAEAMCLNDKKLAFYKAANLNAVRPSAPKPMPQLQRLAEPPPTPHPSPGDPRLFGCSPRVFSPDIVMSALRLILREYTAVTDDDPAEDETKEKIKTLIDVSQASKTKQQFIEVIYEAVSAMEDEGVSKALNHLLSKIRNDVQIDASVEAELCRLVRNESPSRPPFK